MGRFVAFLRGINIGNRRVSTEQLCAAVRGLGYSDVATFLASGNVVLSTDDGETDEIAACLETGLEEALGYPVLTFVRTDAQLAEIAARAPFTATELAGSTGRPQVIVLREPPAPDRAAAALAHATSEDRLVLHGSELHWLPAGGMSQSELDLGAIGRILGPTTIRTANTIARLHAKYIAGAA